jgi:hypothetical protein
MNHVLIKVLLLSDIVISYEYCVYEHVTHMGYQLAYTRTRIVVLLLRIRTGEGVSISFRAGRLERELQMVQLSATGCSCIVIL